MTAVVLYLRVSTEEQVSNLSLDTQEAECRALCAQRGWSVAEIFREEGASVKTKADRGKKVDIMTDRALVTETRDAVDKDASRFSAWELDFTRKMSELVGRGALLSPAQRAKLEEVYMEKVVIK